MMNHGFHGMNGPDGIHGCQRLVTARMHDPMVHPRGRSPAMGPPVFTRRLRRTMMFPIAIPYRRYRGNPLITLLGGVLLALVFRFLFG